MNVKIEKLVYGGEGLGHHDGHTVFVPFVLPDELVAVKATERKKKFVRGRVEHLITPSPGRTAPPCPHFTVCGGCHYQHIPYEAQLAFKAEILRETLSRIGRVRWEGEIGTHASPPFGYRNRAQWKVRLLNERSPSAGDTRPGIGYFRQGSTALCEVEACPILSPGLEQALAALREILHARRLPPSLREFELFGDAAGENILVNISLAEGETQIATLPPALRSAIPGIVSVLMHEAARDKFHLDGPGFLSYRVGKHDYRVGHLSFFQANRFLIEDLVGAVTARERGELALDLFAGVGLFALPLAASFSRVLAVESNSAAARDLAANLETCGGTAQAVPADVEDFLKRFSDKPDFVLLDPPRAGLPEGTAARIASLAPPRMAYLSCDPATLARDLAALTGAGYAITGLDLFDVFPQTYHIETLARLSRVA